MRKYSPEPIENIAKKLNLDTKELEFYGKYKAKLPLHLINEKNCKKNKLILVTSMSPTPQGEGKTTVSIGLCDGLNKIGKKAIVALREPSLGPIFGKKGGATGGGQAQVSPNEDINLHFNGDFSAIEKSNNLLAALIDNYIYHQDRKYQIDPRTIIWKRVADINDRSLRKVITGLGGKTGGVPIESGFNITAASEIMAILCLSKSIKDLKKRIGNIFVGRTYSGDPIFVKDLDLQGPVTLLLKEAIKPNIVQTFEGNPAIIHCGPFANIATGTNSLLATKMALSLSEYVVTEAGFGADLGAEKFFNIICREGNLIPSMAVLVITIKALHYHGDKEGIESGFENLKRHYYNCRRFGVPVLVTLNKFNTDKKEEIKLVEKLCKSEEIPFSICNSFQKGGSGSEDLANQAFKLCQGPNDFHPTYNLELPIIEKIKHLAKDIYGAGQVKLTPRAKKELFEIEKLGLAKLPLCIAKTPLSFSDDPKLKGSPSEFDFLIRDFEFSSGAGFIIPMAGNILRMPAFSKDPNAEKMDISDSGEITGLV